MSTMRSPSKLHNRFLQAGMLLLSIQNFLPSANSQPDDSYSFNLTNFVTDYFHNFSLDNDGGIPYPFEPHSFQYCEAETADEEIDKKDDEEDVYVSIFQPCVFTFYRRKTHVAKDKPSNTTTMNASTPILTCSEIQDSMTKFHTEERRVYGWPDTCVANGSRCYSLEDHPSLYNYTRISHPDHDEYMEPAMPFPSDADYVSVDCSFDYVQAQEFMEHFPKDVAEVAGVVIMVTLVILIGVLSCVLCCCCGVGLTCFGDPCCGGARRRRKKRQQYQEVLVPIQYGNGLPAYSGLRV